ncbi:hypothetical protein HFN60_30115 [Rhizobium leguminosarum]|uniref:hypothetical protein n=1 Tax=Rhizobium leguminosarum TaxID=384 RepID=UPI001C9624B8|nr:hypothetical protein [Rhizobium leguminosarum]MBY5819850.1 hypothetical protein [Rhizobium leguminosarum]
MADEEAKEVDYNDIVAALKEMAKTPNRKNKTLKDHLRDPEMKAAIEAAKGAGYSNEDIVNVLRTKGVVTTAGTFGSYWSEVSREGQANAAPRAKAKSTKAATPKPADTNSEQTAETSPKPDAKASETGSDNSSKSETKPPINPAQRDRKSL